MAQLDLPVNVYNWLVDFFSGNTLYRAKHQLQSPSQPAKLSKDNAAGGHVRCKRPTKKRELELKLEIKLDRHTTSFMRHQI